MSPALIPNDFMRVFVRTLIGYPMLVDVNSIIDIERKQQERASVDV